jgi:IMP dehydrogenase
MREKISSKLKIVEDVISSGTNDFFASLNEAISFDDVLIRPTYTEVLSRSYPSTETNVSGLNLNIPLISSPMDSITGHVMAIEMSRLGGFGVVHRFMSIEDQVSELSKIIDYERENDLEVRKVFAIGVGDDEFERAIRLMECGVGSFVIDVANGHSPNVRNMIKRLRDEVGSEPLSIIAGSIATGDGYSYLADSGANAVRVGIGGGCFVPGTKVLTGLGQKPIENVSVGDLVLTHTGSFKEVIDTMQFDRDEEIVSINGIECTKNHEFYVIHKQDIHLVSEDNIHDYAIWVEAEHLNANDHFLVQLILFFSHNADEIISSAKLNFVEITCKEHIAYKGKVYDLTVKDDHSYTVDNNIVVHNSICKTRIQTGIGVPTLYSVAEASRARQMMQDRSTSIIADGGVRYPADLVKSIVAGADAVICGRIFAGTEETPGEILEPETGKFCKIYAGMASKEVQERRRGGLKKDTCAEGTETIVPFNGRVEDVVSEFLGGLRSAMTYVDAKNLSELRRNSKFIKISRASLEESHSFGTKK